MNSKKKGNIWENKLTNWLRDHGIKAWRDNASGGTHRERGDVGNSLNMTIESKSGKNVALMEWWGQVVRSASMQGNQPVLFIHKDGMPDNEWVVCMHSNDWIEFVKGESKMQEIEEQPRQALYNLERARHHVRQALKDLGESFV